MRSFPSNKRLSGCRGTMLAAFVILIPMAMVLFGLLLTRIEVSLRVTDLEQGRTQARVLAESGVAVLQDRLLQRQAIPVSGVEGSLEGIGRYQITPFSSSKGSGFSAVGSADLKRARHTCTISILNNGGRLSVASYQYHTDSLVAPWPQPQAEPKKNQPFPPPVLETYNPTR